MIDKHPPVADIEAEAAVLGAILYDNKHLSAMPAKLQTESFFSGSHQRIFAAIATLRDENAPVTVDTVAAELRSRKQIAQLEGGREYLERLDRDTSVLTPETFDRLAGIVLDRATQRATQLLLARAAARFSDPSVAVSEALGDLEREILDVSLKTHDNGGLTQVRDALRAEVAEWQERASGRGTPGIPTGYRAYDALTGGLHRGDLVVIAARPGMGKTSLITGLATNVARRGEAVAIFSLEMPARQLAGRMLCTDARVPLVRTRAGKLDPRELTKVQVSLSELAEIGVYVDDASRGRPYVADIISRTRRLAAHLARKKKRVGVVVVDYLQIVKLRDVLVKQRHELAVGEVSTELKSLAKELDCCVIGCAQLNRGVESRPDKRPGMSDLRDSGQIEQDADLIAMLYRDEYYNERTAEPGVVEIIVEKNRHGPTGTTKMRFDGPTTRFEDLEGEYYHGAAE
ncbi:MAG: replicative DNA helicase [Alsobacter sp.]